MVVKWRCQRARCDDRARLHLLVVVSMPVTIEAWPDPNTPEGMAFFAAGKKIGAGFLVYGYNAAIGLLANFERESSLNLNAIGDHDSAFGLAQRHQPRLAAIVSALKLDIKAAVLAKQNTVDNEIRAARWELEHFTFYGRVQIQHAQTPAQSAAEGCMLFERAGFHDAVTQSVMMADRWAKKYPTA